VIYTSPHIVREVTFRRLRWAELVDRMGRQTIRNLVEESGHLEDREGEAFQ